MVWSDVQVPQWMVLGFFVVLLLVQGSIVELGVLLLVRGSIVELMLGQLNLFDRMKLWNVLLIHNQCLELHR